MSNTYISAQKIHNGFSFLPEQSIIETDVQGSIVTVHPNDKMITGTIKHYQGILCPGFVNTHCHLELSHMKGVIAERKRLVPFLQSVMLGRNNFSEEEKRDALQEAVRETYRNGIVAVGDIANGLDTLPIRERAAFHIHTFVESIGFSETSIADRFAWPENVFQKFSEQRSLTHKLSQSVVPHAPYSVSKAMFARINDFEKGSLLSIHNEETRAENEFYRYKTGEMFELYQTLNIDTAFFQPSGKTSLQTYLPYLDPDHPLILVHNTFAEEEDIAFLKRSGRNIFLCLCPNANWHIEGTLPPVHLFNDSGLPICLGTDSLASNHQLSIWSEVLMLQKHFPDIGLETLLRWATYNGAAALKMSGHIGSIEPGKQPGIVHIDPQNRIERIF